MKILKWVIIVVVLILIVWAIKAKVNSIKVAPAVSTGTVATEIAK
jgi:H+/gluconate symporter-like permease